MSFGFKYGVPLDADFVFDMRFLPNPFWVPELRAADRPGRGGRPTTSWRQEGAGEFLDRVVAAAGAGASRATCARASRYVTIAVGCTGGKHRSVAIAEELRRRLRAATASRPSSSTATWGASDA